MGRFFASWVVVYFGQKITEEAQVIGLLFPQFKICIDFEKMGWAG
jgi:hypothetical protein